MKQTIVKIGAFSLLLGATTLPAQAEWFSYVVRTSGLGWSDGYHAYDQCPPKSSCGHFPIRHPYALPGYGVNNAYSSGHAPYYFEEQVPAGAAQPTPAPQLPSAPAEPASNRLLPDPHASHKRRSRYFEALQAEQQQAYPTQTATRPGEFRQAQRPANAPPF
ncbi:hypothetical protein NA78x_003554 [Anatilimnocola sp. NA78]|uniref:hypothetical protein n=1 Tax=Anatilimnocola sp. NA78 TaxID=3415683 RepID=UPI003CE4D4A7